MLKKFKVVKNQHAECYLAEEDGVITTNELHDGSTITYKKGDWICNDPDNKNDIWPIEQSIHGNYTVSELEVETSVDYKCSENQAACECSDKQSEWDARYLQIMEKVIKQNRILFGSEEDADKELEQLSQMFSSTNAIEDLGPLVGGMVNKLKENVSLEDLDEMEKEFIELGLIKKED